MTSNTIKYYITMNIMLSLSRGFHRDRSQFICHKINHRSCFISKLGGVLLVNDVKREREGGSKVGTANELKLHLMVSTANYCEPIK